MRKLEEQLRLRIEERHAKALESLQVLADYLDDSSLLNGDLRAADNAPPPPVRRRRRKAGKSFRDQVLGIITTEWATIGAIAERTKLEERQVRGAINAPGLAERIERRNGANGKEYHLRKDQEN